MGVGYTSAIFSVICIYRFISLTNTGFKVIGNCSTLLAYSNLYSDLTVFEGLNGATRANPLELDIHVHHVCKVDLDGYFRAPSSWLKLYDNAKRRKYEGVCQALGHSFLPMGFTAWGAMSSGTTQLLEKVADAAHEQGYVVVVLRRAS